MSRFYLDTEKALDLSNEWATWERIVDDICPKVEAAANMTNEFFAPVGELFDVSQLGRECSQRLNAIIDTVESFGDKFGQMTQPMQSRDQFCDALSPYFAPSAGLPPWSSRFGHHWAYLCDADYKTRLDEGLRIVEGGLLNMSDIASDSIRVQVVSRTKVIIFLPGVSDVGNQMAGNPSSLRNLSGVGVQAYTDGENLYADEVQNKLAELIEAGEIDKGAEVVIIAHSLGGMAALDLASNPDQFGCIGKIVAVVSVGANGGPFSHSIPEETKVLHITNETDWVVSVQEDLDRAVNIMEGGKEMGGGLKNGVDGTAEIALGTWDEAKAVGQGAMGVWEATLAVTSIPYLGGFGSQNLASAVGNIVEGRENYQIASERVAQGSKKVLEGAKQVFDGVEHAVIDPVQIGPVNPMGSTGSTNQHHYRYWGPLGAHGSKTYAQGIEDSLSPDSAEVYHIVGGFAGGGTVIDIPVKRRSGEPKCPND